MDLNQIKTNAEDIKQDIETLTAKYESIIDSLTILYKVFLNKDETISNQINNLIKRYHSMIQDILDGYVTSANQIIKYVESSNQNIDELTTSLSNISKEFIDTTSMLG